MIRFLLHAFGEFGPSQPVRSTVWPHFDLLYVHEGRLVVRPLVGEPVELAAGEGILLFPDTPFLAGDPRAVARASVQHFELESGQALPGAFGRLFDQRAGFLVRRGPRDEELDHDIQRAIRMASEGSDQDHHMMREAMLVLILGRFLRVNDAVPADRGDLDGLLGWMRGIPPGELSSGMLAEWLGISISTLRREFRERLGISPAQYLKNLRINEGKRLLRETLIPIKEIARRCGYRSAIAFHRAFRETIGTTPRKFRIGNRVA